MNPYLKLTTYYCWQPDHIASANGKQVIYLIISVRDNGLLPGFAVWISCLPFFADAKEWDLPQKVAAR